ncbi:hypothetical protein ACLOJK_007202 [Asimina triloba]
MVIELLEGIHLVASLEALFLGTQAGVHPRILYDILSNAAGSSWIFTNRVPWMLESSPAKCHSIDTSVENLVLGSIDEEVTSPLTFLDEEVTIFLVFLDDEVIDPECFWMTRLSTSGVSGDEVTNLMK